MTTTDTPSTGLGWNFWCWDGVLLDMRVKVVGPQSLGGAS